MSKERITAYLTDKANKKKISKTDIPNLAELIEGYLKLNERYCVDCKFCDVNSFTEPCINCLEHPLKPNFEPKE